MQLEGDEFDWDDLFRQFFPTDIGPGYDPSAEDFFGPYFNRFLELMKGYFEDQDKDDIDRILRQGQFQEFMSVLYRLENGDATFEDLKGVDTEFLSDVDGWNEFQQGLFDAFGDGTEGPEEGTEGPEEGTEGDPSTISDEDAIANVLAKIPAQLKGLITKQNVIEVLKTLGGIEDPMTAIKRGMIAGIEIEFPKDWRDWKVFGTIRIPGVPLPPGIVDVTLRDIEEAVKNVGGTISDFIDGIEDGSSWEKVKVWVRDVWNGVTDEDEWGKSIGGFEDYIRGILGNTVGGFIITGIYDEIKGWFEPEDPVPPVGGEGDEDDGNDTDPTPLQGDDIADLDPDPSLAGDTELDLGDFGSDADDDDDDDTAGGLDDIELGDTEIFDPDPVIPGGDDDDDEIILGDAEDEDEQEVGGGSNGGTVGGGGVGGSPFEGMLKGLSYQPQPVPGIVPPPQIDYAADLDQLIARQLQQRGMLT